MPCSRRAIILALAVSSIAACEDPFADGGPAVSPGVLVPGVANLCTFTGCSAWSADSKTLFIVVNAGNASGTSLMAVDPATLTVRTVGPIDETITAITPTADGAAVFFEADDRTPGGLNIKRMSLSDGSITTVAKTRRLDFAVSPDGTALAYHPASFSQADTAVASPIPPDTIVVLDVPSGVRRAATLEDFGIITAFSGDGLRLSIIDQTDQDAIHVWHIATGVRDTVRIPQSDFGFNQVQWSGAAFHLLYSVSAPTLTDTSLAGGPAITFSVDPNWALFQWLPDRSAIWTASGSQVCEPADCESNRYDFVYVTATKAVTVGAGVSKSLPLMTASPDGHWLAHAERSGALYLLRGPTP